MHQPIFGGWIEVDRGPMSAGKTEEIIRRIRRLEYAKKTVLVFKPSIDNRYSESEIVSHNKTKAKSININKAREILDYVKEGVDAVVIDEAQFLDNDVIWVSEVLADRGIRVIVGGLDRDFRGEPFGPMPQLLAIAEFVQKLTAVCVVSGQPATRTQRLINGKPASFDDPIVLVGAAEAYEPRSRECHEVKNKPKKI